MGESIDDGECEGILTVVRVNCGGESEEDVERDGKLGERGAEKEGVSDSCADKEELGDCVGFNERRAV